jgi:hypothetical protein
MTTERARAHRSATHVTAPVRHGVDQPLVAQDADRAPGRRPGDLELVDDLALGWYPGIWLVLASPDPPPEDRRYLLIRGNRSNRVKLMSYVVLQPPM